MTSVESLIRPKFWELPLSDLNGDEWERLCDGCGRCCLKKFTDDESEAVAYTRIVCRYYDEELARCGCYSERTKLVPDCLDVSSMNLQNSRWMPESCAYRLRFEGKPLYDWHPLLAGSNEKMREEGILIEGKVISEEHVHPDGFEEHIIRWVEA